MKYLFLLLVLTGCAAPKVEKKQNIVNTGDLTVTKKTAQIVSPALFPWENLKAYKGTANSAEEFFTQEELQQYTNLEKGQSIPPLWEKIHLINTNVIPFPSHIWENLEWRKEYKQFAKDLPKNLSPKEATLALSNYVETIYSLSKENFYAFYHFGEMGADFNYKNDAYTNSYEDEYSGFTDYVPPSYGLKGFLDFYKSDFDPINEKTRILSLQILEYMFSKGFDVDYFTDKSKIYEGMFIEPEVLKYLISKGLDLNTLPTQSTKSSVEDLLYALTLTHIGPFQAHIVVALGYTNEYAAFTLTNYLDAYGFRMLSP